MEPWQSQNMEHLPLIPQLADTLAPLTHGLFIEESTGVFKYSGKKADVLGSFGMAGIDFKFWRKIKDLWSKLDLRSTLIK